MNESEFDRLEQLAIRQKIREIQEEKRRKQQVYRERKELKRLEHPTQYGVKQVARRTGSRAGRFVKYLAMKGVETVDKSRPVRIAQRRYSALPRQRWERRYSVIPRQRWERTQQRMQQGQTQTRISLGSPMGLNPSLSEAVRDNTILGNDNLMDRDFFGNNSQQPRDLLGGSHTGENLVGTSEGELKRKNQNLL